MTQEDFNEMFPSLKGKELQLPLEFWMSSMKLEFGTNNLHLYKDDVYGITLKDIKQYCLDKQKVRDAFDKYLLKAHWQVLDKQKEAITKELYEEIIRNFEKELGL